VLNVRLNFVGAIRLRKIRSRRSRIPRPLISPRSPGPVRQPCIPEEAPIKRVAFQLLPWKLIPLELDPPRFTRPTRILLEPWDIRVRRYTSPTSLATPPQLLSPLPPSPRARTRHVAVQTHSAKVHRGLQVQPQYTDQATQSDSDWEPSTSSVTTQTKQHTPESTDENNNHTYLGSLRVTKTSPPIAYRERL